MNERRERRKEAAFIAAVLVLGAALCLLPTGFHSPYAPGTSLPAVARVTGVDNSMIRQIGPVKEGEQQLELRITTGRFAGREYSSSNNLMGKMEIDKFFSPGDRVFVVVDLKNGGAEAGYVNVIDHFRVDVLAILTLLFLGLLVVLGGWTGAKSVLSFAFTALVIFKLLMPAMLWGWDPILTTIGVVAVIEASAIFLIGGLTRRAIAAFAGAMGGVLSTAALAYATTQLTKIHGAVRHYAENLLYSGFGHLDLTGLFIAGVFLASSGAAMDLSMDIAAAMDEIREKNPSIGRAELVRSGMTVGRQVLGTMTTTLLLAYSSGYSALIMTFIAQGVPLVNALNMVFVSAEILHTLVGSLGLVLVAPLTAVAGGLALVGRRDASDFVAGDASDFVAGDASDFVAGDASIPVALEASVGDACKGPMTGRGRGLSARLGRAKQGLGRSGGRDLGRGRGRELDSGPGPEEYI